MRINTHKMIFSIVTTISLLTAPVVFAADTNAVTAAKSVLAPTQGNSVSGVVNFTKVANGVKVVADIAGLTPGEHGFHIHEFGDCSAPDASSAGGHFNPSHTEHGAPTASPHHAGDFGNVVANTDGKAHYEYVDNSISFSGENSILGRGMIVHTSPDDLHTQPTGNSGARVACGVIGVTKP